LRSASAQSIARAHAYSRRVGNGARGPRRAKEEGAR
jgi:hypothetical protein